MKLLVAQSCQTLCNPRDCSPSGSSIHEFLHAKILGWVPYLLQGIFLTQEWNPGLLYCRQILYHLSHQGNPIRSTSENAVVGDEVWVRNKGEEGNSAWSLSSRHHWQILILIVGLYSFISWKEQCMRHLMKLGPHATWQYEPPKQRAPEPFKIKGASFPTYIRPPISFMAREAEGHTYCI